MRCKVCEREAVDRGFCSLHFRAYENLVDCFGVWERALESSWKEYLSQIAKHSLAGDWVKEVSKYLIENEEASDDKQR